MTTLVISNAEIDEVGRGINRYETVRGSKINHNISIGCVGEVSLSRPFTWINGPCKILGDWFGPDIQLEIIWSEVREKAEVAVCLWSHTSTPILLYRLPVLPLPCTELMKLIQISFSLLWRRQGSSDVSRHLLASPVSSVNIYYGSISSIEYS